MAVAVGMKKEAAPQAKAESSEALAELDKDLEEQMG